MKKALRRLADNQIVICEYIGYGNIKYEFFSYDSLIATYTTDNDQKNKIELTDLYDHSRTTSKYLKIFLQTYCYLDYKDTNELRQLIKQGGNNDIVIQVI